LGAFNGHKKSGLDLPARYSSASFMNQRGFSISDIKEDSINPWNQIGNQMPPMDKGSNQPGIFDIINQGQQRHKMSIDYTNIQPDKKI